MRASCRSSLRAVRGVSPPDQFGTFGDRHARPGLAPMRFRRRQPFPLVASADSSGVLPFGGRFRGGVDAPMSESREAGNVPDLRVARVEVVGIELPFVEASAARGAAVVV